MLISYRELETQQCYGNLLQIKYAANKDNTIHKNIHTKPPAHIIYNSFTHHKYSNDEQNSRSTYVFVGITITQV